MSDLRSSTVKLVERHSHDSHLVNGRHPQSRKMLCACDVIACYFRVAKIRDGFGLCDMHANRYDATGKVSSANQITEAENRALWGDR